MNTIKEGAPPLPRINVMRIEYDVQSIAPIYKRRFITASNYAFILWFAGMVLEKTFEYLGMNGHAVAIIPHMAQAWVFMYMIYAATRWAWAWLFGDTKKVKIIG